MRRALYAGTFDPITSGHVSVITRARSLFDEVIVVIAVNPDKSPLFTVEERRALILASTSELSGVQVEATAGMVVHLARRLGANVLIRGVRSATDAAYELELAGLNLGLAPEVQTVFLPAEPSLADISSSRLKQLAQRGELSADQCPLPVLEALGRKLGKTPCPEELVSPSAQV